ncbi:hypothetical protein ABEKA_3248 [Acinetobacter lwoffii]|nr:hypothetical protein ABEKA_1532 [Acinetobacter lwoffii]QZD35153.1 hypothetical protein ABEKA_3248 [Acinetobacter lwoffii]
MSSWLKMLYYYYKYPKMGYFFIFGGRLWKIFLNISVLRIIGSLFYHLHLLNI